MPKNSKRAAKKIKAAMSVTTASSADSLLGMIRLFSSEIKNGRSREDVLKHLRGEVKETRTELKRARKGKTPGKDGVRGEAIDIALCAIDLIFVDDPETTDAEILAIAEEKCMKWKRLYGDSAGKENSPEPA